MLNSICFIAFEVVFMCMCLVWASWGPGHVYTPLWLMWTCTVHRGKDWSTATLKVTSIMSLKVASIPDAGAFCCNIDSALGHYYSWMQTPGVDHRWTFKGRFCEMLDKAMKLLSSYWEFTLFCIFFFETIWWYIVEEALWTKNIFKPTPAV